MTDATETADRPQPDGEELDNKDLAEILQCLATISPHVAEATIKRGEQEVRRHESTLRYWHRPFLMLVGGLGFGVLTIAGIALWRGENGVTQTVVGYLLTYLGGIGTGHLVIS